MKPKYEARLVVKEGVRSWEISCAYRIVKSNILSKQEAEDLVKLLNDETEYLRGWVADQEQYIDWAKVEENSRYEIKPDAPRPADEKLLHEKFAELQETISKAVFAIEQHGYNAELVFEEDENGLPKTVTVRPKKDS